MRLITILNNVTNYKRFILETPKFIKKDNPKPYIEVPVVPRKNSKAICSICNKPAPLYDTRNTRRFNFIPIFNIAVIFIYTMRRVQCPRCKTIVVESVPFVIGKTPVTRELAVYLAGWAKILSWATVAGLFNTTWHQIYASVSYVVEYGLKHRVLDGITAIGIDEVHCGRGQKYITLVYQLCGDTRRLIYIGRDRTTSTLNLFFETTGADWCGGIKYACTDMWAAYLKSIKEHLPNALNILDRFHIVKKINEAVDTVRRNESKVFEKNGIALLKNSRYSFLKRPENLTAKQRDKLNEVLQSNRPMKTVRAYLYKGEFQLFWGYTSSYWALKYLRKWCGRAMHSQLDPLKKFVKTIRKHEALIMNWFIAKKQYNSGMVEGKNLIYNLVSRRAFGYKSQKVQETALYHAMGALPEPETTHQF